MSLLALVVLVTGACEVRADVAMTVAEDGSGTVEVALGLDEEALARVPDLDADGTSDAADMAALLRTEDMMAAGWDVVEPEEDGDRTWVRASKPFGTPAEGIEVLREITGAEGALRDLTLERSDGFGSTSYTFAGTVDLSGGLEAFGDAGLAEVLDGEPLGEDAARIEERVGAPLADAFVLGVSVALPGSIDAPSGEVDGDTVRWTPRLGDEPLPLEASSSWRDVPVMLLAGVAAVSGLALVGVLVSRRLRRERPGDVTPRP